MVNKTWLAISYCCAFISVYLFFLAYAMTSSMINNNMNQIVMPQTAVIANASMGLSSFSSSLGLMPIFVLIGIIWLVLLFLVSATGAMGAAM